MFPKFPELFKWLSKQKQLSGQLKKQGLEERAKMVTHLSMSGRGGGQISLEPFLEDEFLVKYADNILNGEQLYLIEKRTVISKFMGDLDIVRTDGPIDCSLLTSYLVIIQNTVKRFYPEGVSINLFDMAVSKTESTKKENGLTKTGVHFVFPNLKVTQDQSLIMREAIIGNLSLEHGNPPEQNSWYDIVDESVYVNNGLRMIYSRKCTKCPECNNDPENRPYCGECNTTGKIDLGRIYKPWKFIRDGKHDSEIFSMFNNIHTAVRAFSIRTLDTTPTDGFEPYDGAPVVTKSRQSVSKGKVLSACPEDHQTYNRMKNKDIAFETNTTQHNTLETFLRSHVNNAYKRVIVQAILTNPSRNSYTVVVCGDGSSYCMNMKKSHKSNRIYFIVYEDGIIQKCHCKCHTTKGRINGMCMYYQSKKYPISQELKRLLFPGGNNPVYRFHECRNETVSNNPDNHLYNVDMAVHRMAFKLRESDKKYGGDGSKCSRKRKRN